MSAREEDWGDLTDSELLVRGHAQSRFVMTHDSDFGTLAVHRGESLTGILYLRPGGWPPAEVIVDIEALLNARDRLEAPGSCRAPCTTSQTPKALQGT